VLFVRLAGFSAGDAEIEVQMRGFGGLEAKESGQARCDHAREGEVMSTTHEHDQRLAGDLL
jgi:hypothetical protein